MKVLITGSSGLIGRWVVKRLKSEGHQIVGLDRDPVAVPDVDEHICCDILDKPALLRAVQRVMPDVLIHLAARTDLNEKDNIQGYAANIDGVRNVLEAVKQTPSIHRVIYTSSQLVCRVGYVPESDNDYCPNTLYGESKVLTEKIVREADGGGKEWCLVRPTTVWGPYMSHHYQRVLALIAKGMYFHVGRAKLFKSYSYAGNIAFQYYRLMVAPAESVMRQTFYLADYEPLSLRNYLDSLQAEINAPSIPSYPLWFVRMLAVIGDLVMAAGWRQFPFNSFRLNNILTEYQFDLSATKAVCGELPYSFTDGVKATAEWYCREIAYKPVGK